MICVPARWRQAFDLQTLPVRVYDVVVRDLMSVEWQAELAEHDSLYKSKVLKQRSLIRAQDSSQPVKGYGGMFTSQG